MEKLDESKGRESEKIDNKTTFIEYGFPHMEPEKFDELLVNRWNLYPVFPANKKAILVKDK